MTCFEFKGGIGTASRRLDREAGGYTVGVLVQANFGLRAGLAIAGVPVGREITEGASRHAKEEGRLDHRGGRHRRPAAAAPAAAGGPRAPLGLARMGSSGERLGRHFPCLFDRQSRCGKARNGARSWRCSPTIAQPALFAAVEATEEAILNALVAARTMTGINDYTVHALPHDRLVQALKKHGRLLEAGQRVVTGAAGAANQSDRCNIGVADSSPPSTDRGRRRENFLNGRLGTQRSRSSRAASSVTMDCECLRETDSRRAIADCVVRLAPRPPIG